jgi:hypothetical protein
VVAGTVAVLSALTYGWTAMGQPRKTDAVTSATPGPTIVPASSQCVVSYAVWSDTGADFKAQVTLANRDDTPVDKWNLWFLMNGDQVMSGNGKLALTQDDRMVQVSSAAKISPQRTTTIQITGRYTESNAAPMVFKLNGQTCETYVSAEPGEPSRPVEHLSDGRVRLGAPTTSPGISIGPSGSVHITPPPTGAGGKPTVKPAPGTTTTPTTTPPGGGGPTISVEPSVPPSVGPPSNNPGVGETTTTPPPVNSPPPLQPVDCDEEFDNCPSAGS